MNKGSALVAILRVYPLQWTLRTYSMRSIRSKDETSPSPSIKRARLLCYYTLQSQHR